MESLSDNHAIGNSASAFPLDSLVPPNLTNQPLPTLSTIEVMQSIVPLLTHVDFFLLSDPSSSHFTLHGWGMVVTP